MTAAGVPRGRRGWLGLLPWLITAACFFYLYTRLGAVAARHGQTPLPYLAQVFAGVAWGSWLALMIPYSLFYFLIDSAVVWRVVRWFNAPLRYSDVLPIRGSSFILSIVNEQVGKGAMGLYLNRRYGTPGWEIASSLFFIMFCEFYYLLAWAIVGWALRRDELPPEFGALTWLGGAAALFLALWLAFFRGSIAPASPLRERPVFHAFRRAHLGHYLGIMALRSPALLAAAVVYAGCARLFGVETSALAMLSYVPVVFFGAATPGPMRSVAITLWVLLFPGHEGAMTAFGLVQHNFFIFFNAAIGLLFLRRANRELFGMEDPR